MGINKETCNHPRKKPRISTCQPIQHPDFCCSMAEFGSPTSLNGVRSRQPKQSRTPFEREYHLAQCGVCANTCGPELAELLGLGESRNRRGGS